jgi:hypothetical protein
MTKVGQRASAPRRLLKYWSVPRVEAEGVDGKERMRRIPAAGCTEGLTQPAARSDSRPKGCVEFGPESFRGCSLGRDRSGYRHCVRALANAKINSNAAHSGISTVSKTGQFLES